MDDQHKNYRVWWDETGGVVRTDWFKGAVCGISEARAIDAEITFDGTRAGSCRSVDLSERSSRSTGQPVSSSWPATPITAQSRSWPARRRPGCWRTSSSDSRAGENPVKMFTVGCRCPRMAASAAMSAGEVWIHPVIELLTLPRCGSTSMHAVRDQLTDGDLDAVMVGINMLAEELGAHRAELEERVAIRTFELERRPGLRCWSPRG